MRRVSAVVTSAANPTSPLADTWVSVALTYHGLKALGVPQDSLDSFAWEFRQGMAARAKELGDTGDSGPENWRRSGRRTSMSCSSPSRRMVRGSRRCLSALGVPGAGARDNGDLAPGLPRAAHREGAVRIQDGISHPAIEGSGIPGTNPKEQPQGGRIRSGLSRRDGRHPEDSARSLGRNGTYVVFRKLHQRGGVPPVPEGELDQP